MSGTNEWVHCKYWNNLYKTYVEIVHTFQLDAKEKHKVFATRQSILENQPIREMAHIGLLITLSIMLRILIWAAAGYQDSIMWGGGVRGIVRARCDMPIFKGIYNCYACCKIVSNKILREGTFFNIED